MNPDIDAQQILDEIKAAGLGCVPHEWEEAFQIYKLATLLNMAEPQLKKLPERTETEDILLETLKKDYITQIEQVLGITIEEKSFRHARPKTIGKRFTDAKQNARNYMKDRPLSVARKISSDGYEQFFPEEKKLSIASITQAKKG